jgi:hypothetical protein
VRQRYFVGGIVHRSASVMLCRWHRNSVHPALIVQLAFGRLSLAGGEYPFVVGMNRSCIFANGYAQPPKFWLITESRFPS